MKEYYSHLDALKGWAILLMVMGHSIAWSYPDWHFLTLSWHDMSTEQFNASFIWKIIYSFHMPMLFFVSGFLFYKKGSQTIETVCSQIVKRARRLLIPYLSTGVFVLFLKGYFGYWFFIVLFILDMIFLFELYIEDALNMGKNSRVVCHGLVFVTLYFILHRYTNNLPVELSNLSGLPQYYLVFIFGYLVHKYSKLERMLICCSGAFFSSVAYMVLMVVVVYFGKLKMLGIFIPLAAISFLYGFSLKEKCGLGGVKMIGRNSMEIYVFHLFFVIQFPNVGNYVLELNDFPTSISIQLVYSLLLSAIAIFFSVIMARLIKSNEYLSKILFG